MLHLLLIAMMAVVLARDGAPGIPVHAGLAPGLVASVTATCTALLMLGQHAAMLVCGRGLDRSGSWRFVAAAEFVMTAARWAALALHAWAVFGLGWLDAVRTGLGGNWIAVDELLAAAPPLVVVVMGWASYYSIDRRLREASLLSALDAGATPPSLPTRLHYVVDQARFQVLLVVVPVGLIASWAEGADRALARLPAPWSLTDTWQGSAASATTHLLGVALALVFMPLVIRLLWDTVSLGPGPLRERLDAMCAAQRVRCRDLLVWRTHSGMLNGAVIGLVPRLRYILLTDTLLNALAPVQVEAVMAHELAHARKHHLPWLMAAIVATLSLSWTASVWSLTWAVTKLGMEEIAQWLALAIAVASTATLTIAAFGWVSRRFEQQADAFAAQHLSGRNAATEGRRDVVITADAAIAMASALGLVARLNHIDRRAFSFRHGSIASRQRNIERLVGRPAHALRIDRVVAAVKVIALLGVVLTVALSLLLG